MTRRNPAPFLVADVNVSLVSRRSIVSRVSIYEFPGYPFSQKSLPDSKLWNESQTLWHVSIIISYILSILSIATFILTDIAPSFEMWMLTPMDAIAMVRTCSFLYKWSLLPSTCLFPLTTHRVPRMFPISVRLPLRIPICYICRITKWTLPSKSAKPSESCRCLLFRREGRRIRRDHPRPDICYR